MKKLALLFTAFICLAFTANVLGQVKPVIPAETTAWGKYDHPHVVALGSTFEYQVEKHTTLSFQQLKDKIKGATGIVGNDNRYVWELYKVSYDGATKEYTILSNVEDFGDDDSRFTEATNNLGKFSNTYVWTTPSFTSDEYYLVRVSEYADHMLRSNASSELADKNTKVVSEIIVKIGEELQIFIPKTPEQEDYFYCYQDGDRDDKSALLTKIDGNAGLMTLKFNGRPGVKADGDAIDGFKFKLSITKFKDGETNAPADVFIEIPAADATYIAEEGYYTYDFGLSHSDIVGSISDIDASSKDIYYTVEVVGFLHGDSADVNNYTAFVTEAEDGTSTTKKINRTYGIYTKPVITQINHK